MEASYLREDSRTVPPEISSVKACLPHPKKHFYKKNYLMFKQMIDNLLFPCKL